eukprot:TRINITY_DN11083_c0_g1_i3.p1 TRINITY_DN11083_c0_g1~~TRINITY_DN11083_c0_g1_i3.p1  ORF type:complete len:446 (+),score=73.64 TRINITY_DN11083_c0_g1_i3:39-1376(+)
MALQCAITGEVPKEPVISPKSGAVFERSAIVKQIASTGADPVNDEPLSEEELIAIKTPEFSVPRPPNATSLPALLKSFQDEWDASMLESFELKKQNQQLRQELTQSLYQYDASTRVIARLIKERDQARQALSTLQPNGVTPAASAPAAPQDTGMDVADESANSTLPAEAVSAIEATAATLSKGRKKRAKPADLASPDAISGLASSHKQSGLHSSRSGVITSMAVQASRNLIVTGGSDKTANVFDYEKQEKVHTLKGHTKKVWSVDAHASEAFAVTGSADKSIGFWNLEDGSGTQRINVHSSDVTGVAIHPTGQHVLSCSKDNSWAFIDINTATSLGQTTDDDSTNGGPCHPELCLCGAMVIELRVSRLDCSVDFSDFNFVNLDNALAPNKSPRTWVAGLLPTHLVCRCRPQLHPSTSRRCHSWSRLLQQRGQHLEEHRPLPRGQV